MAQCRLPLQQEDDEAVKDIDVCCGYNLQSCITSWPGLCGTKIHALVLGLCSASSSSGQASITVDVLCHEFVPFAKLLQQT
jgi:hypothetical protein